MLKDKISQKEEILKNDKNNIIIIPPEQQEKNLRSSIKEITSMPLPVKQNGQEEEDSSSHIKLLQQKLFEHYHTVAYTLIILTVSRF